MGTDLGRVSEGASQATGLGSAKAPEPSGLGPTGAIPSAAWTEQEHYYLHSILRNLRGLDERVCEEWQGVSLQSEALGDNIDWLDCFITSRCAQGAACEQCWPNRE